MVWHLYINICDNKKVKILNKSSFFFAFWIVFEYNLCVLVYCK